jgi:hypothetical protein
MAEALSVAQAATAPYMDMSASLLSQQPATSPEKLQPDAEWWITIYGYLEARLGVLRTWRYSWWAHWSRLAEFFLPRRYHWLVVANRMARGNPINDRIIDSTGTLAVQTCASGMWTGLTSPSRPWFKLDKALPWVELDADGKEWLEDTEARVYTVLGQSNFYTIMAQAFQDVVVFGTAPVIIYEDFEDVIRCYLPCAGEAFLAAGARLSIDTLYREFTFTVQQIVEFATLEKCPKQIQDHWQANNLDTEYVVCHAIEPNFDIAKKGQRKATVTVVPGIFPYREVYWLKGIKTPEPLSRRGFRMKPFMCARWATVSNEPYGRSPCMDALGDDKQLQLETVRKAEFIEKGVRPPMGANPELKNEPNSILPGHTTYMSTDGGKKGFWPLFEVAPAWLTGLAADIKEVSQRIEKCLFVDLFMAISRMEGVQPRNELELTKRDLERLQSLGPFIELFETEFAGPAIQRVLEILENRRMLKPKPRSLQNVPLKINYMSIMKLAQRSAETVAMKDVFGTMGELSSAAKAAGVPDPIRVIDLDKAARKYGELANFPAECFFTEQEVIKHDQAREQGQQQAAAPGQAMAAVSAAKTLADTKLAPGTALGALTGMPTQGNA